MLLFIPDRLALTDDRPHAIGVLDSVQEEVGPLCNSESSSSLIKDILIFIRHVSLLNTTAPVASTLPHTPLAMSAHTQGNIIRDQCVGTHRTKSTQGNIIRNQCVYPCHPISAYTQSVSLSLFPIQRPLLQCSISTSMRTHGILHNHLPC